MKETEEIATDYLPIVRAMVKMSSALSVADDIVDGKYYKFNFKRKFREWMEIFEVTSEPLMKAFMEDGETALQEAYTRFLKLTERVVKDSDRTNLILFYCKLKSAYKDLDEITFEDGGLYTFIIKKQTSKVLIAIEKQYGDIFTVKDEDGDGIDAIIGNYDHLGKSMFTKEK